MAARKEPRQEPAAPPAQGEPAEKKLPGVPGHLQAAVQQLIGEPAAKKPRGKG